MENGNCGTSPRVKLTQKVSPATKILSRVNPDPNCTSSRRFSSTFADFGRSRRLTQMIQQREP